MKLCELLSKAKFCQLIAVNIDVVITILKSCCTVNIKGVTSTAVLVSFKKMRKNIFVTFN